MDRSFAGKYNSAGNDPKFTFNLKGEQLRQHF